jgi:uncharacterized membrane protein
MADIAGQDSDELVKLVGRRVRSLGFWSLGIWWAYICAKIIAYVAGVLVPFGLALLFYLPQSMHNKIQIALLVLSFIAIATQGVIDSLRFRDRSLRLRILYRRLEADLAKFRSGLITVEALAKYLDKNREEFLERDLP